MGPRVASNHLTPVVEGRVWTTVRGVWFAGVRLRAHSTVLRLEDGGLLLHSPSPPTPGLEDALRALGPVRWLCVPNRFHHLGTPAAARAFPEAKVLGPRSALERNPALRLDIEIQSDDVRKSIPEIDTLPLSGVPFLDETVLFHKPSQTLIGADIVLSACAKDHWTWRTAGRLTGCYDKVRVPPDVRGKVVDKGAAARSIERIQSAPAQRLLVAHADVIEGDWARALTDAWRRVGA
jgi:hypothetical protein